MSVLSKRSEIRLVKVVGIENYGNGRMSVR